MPSNLPGPLNHSIYHAPEDFTGCQGPKVFLAGSIEMGIAEDWQDLLSCSLRAACEGIPLSILNPRRKDWNPSWKQEASNPYFRQQVEWELSALEQADIILMYFSPETKSPISLLELGLFACPHRGPSKLVVYCPKPFWRKSHVNSVWGRCGIIQVDSFEDMVRMVQETALAFSFQTAYDV